MSKTLTLIAAAIFSASFSIELLADGKTEGALTLIDPPGARAAGLGEAFASMSNDVTAMGYNPASLRTLKSAQASFLFQKGLGEDSSGHFLIGAPGTLTGVGLSVGYYNSGTVDAFDGTTQRSVTGQRDLTVGIGLARNLGPATIGVTGKYLSSELGERATASTFTSDFGMQIPVHERLRVGGAVQNLGGQLRYVSLSDDLPRMARLGFAWTALPQTYFTTLVVEGVYHLNQQIVRPALGVETLVGPLAFRMGYKSGSDLAEFNFGAGFLWGSSSLDYTFGLVNELSSSHMISLSTRFGADQARTSIVKKKPESVSPAYSFQPPDRPVYEIKAASGENPAARVYWVKEGDTLQSISKSVYGREEMADDIFRANLHLLADPNHLLSPGQKIVLPAAAQ